MTDGDEGPLTDVDRRSMRILARSTKAAGPNNARIADRLEKAAGTGNRGDYRRAEESFDSLPPRERQRIGTHAERQAETEKELLAARKLKPAPVKPKPPAADDSLDWKPLIMSHSPATDPADEVVAKPAAQAQVPRPSVPRPMAPNGAPRAAPKAGSGRTPADPSAAPARAKRPSTTAARPVADEPEEPDRNWDWQRIPEDPVLKSTRRKGPADPIAELRRQMLGDDSKRR
ncbi:hypothetical protein [Thalassobaculum sp.]|uniref:hypothetical protein n=1 Tax=Thalassobaculum sp. TaxID=2022740 RepID=UPI0032ED5E61